MILAAALLVAIAVAWMLGANVARLADLRLRGGALVFAALGTQLVIFTPLSEYVPTHLAAPLHVGTYLLLLAFLVLNFRHFGLWLAGLGLIANAVAIFANGGRMPVSLEAWKARETRR